MNSKNLLLSIVIMFCAGVEFSSIAMDGVIIKQPVTFKSLEGIPCWSWNRLNNKK